MELEVPLSSNVPCMVELARVIEYQKADGGADAMPADWQHTGVLDGSIVIFACPSEAHLWTSQRFRSSCPGRR